MTTTHAGYVVVLDANMREDDAQATIAALQQIKGVIDVKPLVGGGEQAIATSRAKHAILTKLYEVLEALAKDR